MSTSTPAPCDVVYIGFLTGHGGDAVQMLHLAQGVQHRGASVRVVVPAVESSIGFAEQCRRVDVRCERTGLIRADMSGAKQRMGSMLELVGSITEPVVHFHTGNPCLPRSLTTTLELTRSRRSFVTVHSPYETIRPGSVRARFWAAAARRRFHAVVSPSDHASAYQRACGVPSTHTVTIRNAIDLRQISNGDGQGPRAELGLGVDDPLIVFTSRMDEQKRPQDAVRMFARVAQAHPRARLAFVGAGGECAGVATLAGGLGVSDRVHLMGYRNNIADWLNAATVWILPTERENFSVAVLEALAAGRPVLSTSCEGNTEVLVDEDNALLFSPGDIASGSERLARLLTDVELRQRLARRGAECAERYGIDRMVDEYLDLYSRSNEIACKP